jgi:hypothetical protein
MAGRPPPRPLLLALCLAATLAVTGGPRQADRSTSTTFGALVASLSEPGGYFDTDNLISNERSYLSVVPELRRLGLRDGAYIGVGPDQNFSYIAALEPSIAFIVDIRRDNLLLHLLFKALFAAAPTRVEYLARLTGRVAPADAEAWTSQTVEAIVAYVDSAAAVAASGRERLYRDVAARVSAFGVPMTAADAATVRRFHERFVADGLSLRFQSLGRAPQYYYPTYRELLVGTDGEGRQASFLASERAYGIVRALEARDRIVPVTGNLAGPDALRAVAALLAARGVPLHAFYASNVEFYLFRDGSFPRFLDNLAAIPRADRAVLIRSVFGGGDSVSSIEPLGTLLARRQPARDRRNRR